MKDKIIPKVGQWVHCHGSEDHFLAHYSAGKVESVDLEKRTFHASFMKGVGDFGQQDVDEDDLPFEDIEEIVTDPDEIRQLEGELSGEIVVND